MISVNPDSTEGRGYFIAKRCIPLMSSRKAALCIINNDMSYEYSNIQGKKPAWLLNSRVKSLHHATSAGESLKSDSIKRDDKNCMIQDFLRDTKLEEMIFFNEIEVTNSEGIDILRVLSQHREWKLTSSGNLQARRCKMPATIIWIVTNLWIASRVWLVFKGWDSYWFWNLRFRGFREDFSRYLDQKC